MTHSDLCKLYSEGSDFLFNLGSLQFETDLVSPDDFFALFDKLEYFLCHLHSYLSNQSESDSGLYRGK